MFELEPVEWRVKGAVHLSISKVDGKFVCNKWSGCEQRYYILKADGDVLSWRDPYFESSYDVAEFHSLEAAVAAIQHAED